MLVLGIDIGTQGARVVACDKKGTVWARAEAPFPAALKVKLPPGWAEQDPEAWWLAVQRCLQMVLATLADRSASGATIEAVAVTSTSGTVVPIDAAGRPLRPALMYNDSRAHAEAELVQAAGQAQARALGYRFSASFALSKILWLRRHEPQLFDRTACFCHATDFVVGRLSGIFRITDFSNALKTGYNLQQNRWPGFIEASLDIPLDRLPQVIRPGSRIAETSTACREATGLPAGIPLLAGMTDGCASQISTGAVSPGDWNSTLGTTLVIKGVTKQLLRDPQGRIYSHRHPAGYWLPGGASNTGGAAISHFPRHRWPELNERALALVPSGVISYPLIGRGERFPFAKSEAEGFVLNPVTDEAADYAACLEGVGYLERLAYDMLTGLGASVGETIYSAGGATKSRAWSQIRADILGRTLARPQFSGGAMGAAILAASGGWFPDLASAARAMVTISERIEPRPALAAAFEARYQQFCAACRVRDYI